MEYIFHEKQQGSLCAQHCLNALLQGSYFTAVDLAAIGSQMDEEERRRMAEAGVNSDDYETFLQQPSGNVDDSGYFSIQVLSSALEVWGLELVPYTSTDLRAVKARANPVEEQAFICNYRDHWLTIRKLGNQWFNLNSLLSSPELLSDSYVTLFLAQLLQEGYSIFVVVGTLPNCEANNQLKLKPAVQVTKPRLIAESDAVPVQDEDPVEAEILKQTLEMSRREFEEEEERESLERALQMSIAESRRKGAFANPGTSTGTISENEYSCTSDDDLRRAIQLSLQAEDTISQMPSANSDNASVAETADSQAFVRQQRLARFEKSNKPHQDG